MTRSPSSAKSAGTRFERSIADALAAHVDDRIDRKVKTGSSDRGDIGGVRSAHGLRVCIEAKDVAKLALGGWYREAVTEMGNDDAAVALVVHKRKGKGDPLDQWVTCTVRDLVALLRGARPDDEEQR